MSANILPHIGPETIPEYSITVRSSSARADKVVLHQTEWLARSESSEYMQISMEFNSPPALRNIPTSLGLAVLQFRGEGSKVKGNMSRPKRFLAESVSQVLYFYQEFSYKPIYLGTLVADA
jgi:hypothetical protein